MTKTAEKKSESWLVEKKDEKKKWSKVMILQRPKTEYLTFIC